MNRLDAANMAIQYAGRPVSNADFERAIKALSNIADDPEFGIDPMLMMQDFLRGRKFKSKPSLLHWTRELCLLALGALCIGSGVIWFFKDTGTPVVIVATACALIAGAWFWRVRP